MQQRKPSKTVGDIHVAQETSVEERGQFNILDSANRWLSIINNVLNLLVVLQSLLNHLG